MPRWQEPRAKAFPVGSILLIACDTPKFDIFSAFFKAQLPSDNIQWTMRERVRQTPKLGKELDSQKCR